MNHISPKASIRWEVCVTKACSLGLVSNQGLQICIVVTMKLYQNILKVEIAAQYFHLVVCPTLHTSASFQCVDNIITAAIICGAYTVRIAQTAARAFVSSLTRWFTISLFLFWFPFWACCCRFIGRKEEDQLFEGDKMSEVWQEYMMFRNTPFRQPLGAFERQFRSEAAWCPFLALVDGERKRHLILQKSSPLPRFRDEEPFQCRFQSN